MKTRLNTVIAGASLVAVGLTIGTLTNQAGAGAPRVEWSHAEIYQPASPAVRVVNRLTLEAGVPVTIDIPALAHVSTSSVGEDVYYVPALSVVLNLTVVRPTADGYLTAWPAGEPQPEVSNVNFDQGVLLSNLAHVKVADGQIQLVSNVKVVVVVDQQGQWDALQSSPLP